MFKTLISTVISGLMVASSFHSPPRVNEYSPTVNSQVMGFFIKHTKKDLVWIGLVSFE